MKPGSDAARIGTLANLRFAYEFSYKNSHKNKSVRKCGKPDFFGAERSEARKKSRPEKF